MTRTNPLVIAARLVFGLLTWTAIVVQGARQVAGGFPLLNFFSYFTILSNAIAGTVLIVTAWAAWGARRGVMQRPPSAALDLARGAATLYMAVVGVVFVMLLRNVDLGGLLPWVNNVHHYVMPVVMVGDWLLVRPTTRPSTRTLVVYLSFPLAYVIYSLLRGAAIGWYPYPFFNPAIVGGYGVVAAYVSAMIVTFVVFAWLLQRTAPAARR